MDKLFVNFLPPWVETNIQPAFYDKESGSVLQQTARMYAKVNCLVRMFNKLSKETKETVDEYIAKFVELKDFVDTYFENLDVQEEINNKLDEMAEDGTLQALLQNYFPLGDVSFNKLSYIKTSKSDLYAGYDHSSLQGFCLLPNGNAVIALRSTQEYDNYVKLCEVNYKTGTVLRYVYLELQHANSLSYRSDNHTIYVAACNTASGGSVSPDNRIFVVDYTDFSIIKTINVSNIPDGHRIRSVWYDNVASTLYAGDIHEMYIIDETTETITETIALDTTYIDTNATNQTLKKVGNYYFGLYISFLAIWDITGKLVRLINIDTIQQNDYVGEPEDFAFDEDDNVVLGSTVSESPRLDYTYTNFYVSNLSKGGKESISNYWGAGTSPCPVYVDINSAETEELGTPEKPFKDLQVAINYAKNLPKFAKIYLASGTYDYSYITGVAYMEFQPNDGANVVINGIEVVGSRVRFLNSTADLTINGIYSVDSDFRVDSQNSLNIYKNALTSSIGYGFCVRSEGGTVSLIGARIEGEDDKNLTYISNNSIASFNTCSFYGYDGYYAIRANNNSIVYTFDNTYDETLSDTQHIGLLEQGSRLYHRNGNYDKNSFVLATQGMVYPSAGQVSTGDVYYGNVCTLDTHYNQVQITIKIAGTSVVKKTQNFELSDLHNSCISTSWVSNDGLRVASLKLSVDSETNVLSISENRFFTVANDGTCDSQTTTTTPSSANAWKFACIKKITFCNN